jgi:predicted transcriptional regulator
MVYIKKNYYCRCTDKIMCHIHKVRYDYEVYKKENSIYPYNKSN